MIVILGILVLALPLVFAQDPHLELLDSGVTSAVNEKGEPVDSKNSFKPIDEKVVAWINVRTDGGVTVFFNWYSPDGKLYQQPQAYQLEVRPPPNCYGFICLGEFYKKYVSFPLYIGNTPAAKLFGKWRVEITYKNSVIKTLQFEIVAPTHKVIIDMEPRVGTILVDNESIPSTKLPASFEWFEASQHIVTAQASIQGSGSGSSYVFSKWSDGDTSTTRTITVNGPLSLTAIYETKASPNTDVSKAVPAAISPTTDFILYLAAGGGTLVIVVSVLFFRTRKKERATEIYLSKQEYPGEKGTKVYGQASATDETRTRVFATKERKEKDEKSKSSS